MKIHFIQEMPHKFQPGDKVITLKGCRFNGPPGEMTVVETGKKWKWFKGVTCRKPNGKISLFLEKNLRLSIKSI